MFLKFIQQGNKPGHKSAGLAADKLLDCLAVCALSQTHNTHAVMLNTGRHALRDSKTPGGKFPPTSDCR